MTVASFDASYVSSKACQMRLDIIEMLAAAGSGHPGGSLSAADIVAVLYFGGVLRYDPHHLDDPHRDRFVLSKGHAAPVQYAALVEAGVIDRSELSGLRHLGRMLQGHPHYGDTPGIEVSTGSLGQGVSVCCGIAQGLKLKQSSAHVYTLLGDGELQEGLVWEAAMYAAHHKLDNLTMIIDNNGLQIDGSIDTVLSPGDIVAKFNAFGCDTVEVDGHDVSALHAILSEHPATSKPRVIVAHTVKGKGVSFMENLAGWHGKAPNAEEAVAACRELRGEGGEA